MSYEKISLATHRVVTRELSRRVSGAIKNDGHKGRGRSLPVAWLPLVMLSNRALSDRPPWRPRSVGPLLIPESRLSVNTAVSTWALSRTQNAELQGTDSLSWSHP